MTLQQYLIRQNFPQWLVNEQWSEVAEVFFYKLNKLDYLEYDLVFDDNFLCEDSEGCFFSEATFGVPERYENSISEIKKEYQAWSVRQILEALLHDSEELNWETRYEDWACSVEKSRTLEAAERETR